MEKMKITTGLILFMLFGCAASSYTQTWNEKADFEGGERFGMSYFSLNGDAYMLGGLKEVGGDYTAYDDLWLYDEDEDTWEIISEYPGGNIYGGFAFVLNNTVYVGLGANQFGVYNDEFWSYNTTDGWVEKADFPANLRVYPFAFSGDEKGYVGSGIGAGYYADLWEYDPSSDEWTTKADYPGGGRVGQVAFSISHYGYVGLGDDGGSYYNDFYQYDAELDVWVPRSSFFGDNRSFSSSTSVNGNGYMVGGESVGGGFTNEMWSYDPIGDSWEESYDFTELARRYGVLYFIDGSFYYGLGQFGFDDSQVLGDFWEYESGIVGIESTELREDIAVYPNPTTDQVRIIGDFSSDDILIIKVYNNLMQEVYTTNQMTINMGDWENAVYYIQITTERGTLTQKVIKQ